jgi:hypothetical protein
MTFQDWFAIATKNIAESELPEIRNELENHVLDAIAVQQQTGILALEAEQKAVLELGDPKRAARGFARSHLTKRDVRRINTPTVFSRVFAVVFALAWWGLCEAIAPNLFTVFSDKASDALTIFRFLNISSFVVQMLLLLVQIFRGQMNAFQWRLCSISLETILGVAGFFAWTLIPVPFTLPLWFPWVVIFLTGIAYSQSEIPLLRKLQTRA